MNIEKQPQKIENQKNQIEKKEVGNPDDRRMSWWKEIAASKTEEKDKPGKELLTGNDPEHLKETAQLDSQRLEWWKEAAVETSQQQ